MNSTRQPARFEDRLQAELETVVANRVPADPAGGGATARTRSSGYRFGWKSRLAVAGAGAAALALGAGPVFGLQYGTPAWAVDASDDGWVTVHINRFSDAAGLQARLEELGIPADVTYVPVGTQCRQPRFERAPGGHLVRTTLRADEGEPTMEFSVRRTDVPPGDTLVIAGPKPEVKVIDPPRPLTVHRDGRTKQLGITMYSVEPSVDFARGPVAPCEIVPLEAK